MPSEARHATGLDGGRRAGRKRPVAGMVGVATLALLVLACLLSLPWTLGSAGVDASGRALPPRYERDELSLALRPPGWAEAAVRDARTDEAAAPADAAAAQAAPVEPRFFLMGSDKLGRDVFVRCLAGGGVSILIGLAAAAISVVIGTLYGAVAGAVGGRVDSVMMRAVDVLYGLPYVLLVVLLAVAGDTALTEHLSRGPERRAYVEAALAQSPPEAENVEAARDALMTEAIARFPRRDLPPWQRQAYEVGVLLVAIGSVSWLTMARVIRGQVLSLRSRTFMEAARAAGVPAWRQFTRHLLPNLAGPILVYATLIVPQAILQESFLSFLGIGVKPPLPSWGGLASEGLVELNPVRVRWWLIVFPCVLLGSLLLSLNLVGEWLREEIDPRSRGRG